MELENFIWKYITKITSVTFPLIIRSVLPPEYILDLTCISNAYAFQ